MLVLFVGGLSRVMGSSLGMWYEGMGGFGSFWVFVFEGGGLLFRLGGIVFSE